MHNLERKKRGTRTRRDASRTRAASLLGGMIVQGGEYMDEEVSFDSQRLGQEDEEGIVGRRERSGTTREEMRRNKLGKE